MKPTPQPPGISKQRIIMIVLATVALLAACGIVNIINSQEQQKTAQIPQQLSTPTPTPTQKNQAPFYVPSSATLAFQDPLQDNSNGFHWLVNENRFGSCSFQNNAYHAVVYGYTDVVFHACIIEKNVRFRNFVYQVTMNIQNGKCGGIIFRSQDPQLYYFKVCVDGTYKFANYLSDSDGSNVLANGSLSTSIQVGQPIELAVVANGSNMVLYINRQQVVTVTDETYTGGQIGVMAANKYTGDSTTTEVDFSNAYVWTF